MTNCTFQAESPGHLVTPEQLDMLYARYQLSGQFVMGKEVLEVACGPGLGLGYLHSKGAKVLGIDISKRNIAIATSHYKGRYNIFLEQLDIEGLPIVKDTCDVLLCLEAIYYLKKPSAFLDATYRRLKAGGYFIISMPNKLAPGFIPSPLANWYPEAETLGYSLKAMNWEDIIIYGGFPIKAESLSKAIPWGSKWLGKVPGGKLAKAFLNKKLFGRTIHLEKEILPEIVDKMQYHFEQIPLGINNPRYKIIYAVCKKGEQSNAKQ